MDIAATFMPLFFAVLALLGLGVLAMAVGVIFRRPCLRGSCGGTPPLGPDGQALTCDTCPRRKVAQSAPR